jgi:hypothetical protein
VNIIIIMRCFNAARSSRSMRNANANVQRTPTRARSGLLRARGSACELELSASTSMHASRTRECASRAKCADAATRIYAPGAVMGFTHLI